MSFLTYIFCGAVLYCTNILMKPSPSAELRKSVELEKKKRALINLTNDIKTRFASMNDYYTVLGVTKKSTPTEIKHAFESALQIYNIDVFTHLLGNKNNMSSTINVFVKSLTDAYAILGDASNKYYYDNKDIIQNITDPDDLINQFIDGFVDDFDPTDKASYWKPSELTQLRH